MIPTREQIREKALEQYHNDNPHILTNPEYEELLESGYIFSATNELMISEKTKNAQWLEQETENQQPQQPKPLEKPQYIENPIPFSIEDAIRSGIFLSGTRQCGKTTFSQNYITPQLEQKGIIVYVLDPTRAWQTRQQGNYEVIPIPPKTQNQVTLKWQLRNTIFDMSKTHIDEYVEFAELFSGTLFDAVIDLPNQPQIFVWYEEAHTPMPNFSFFSKRLRETKRLITQGANYHISFGAITQFAALIDKLPVKATQQRYFGLTSEPNDINYIRKFIGKDWANKLSQLNTGEFIYNRGKTTTQFKTTIPTETSQSVFNYAVTYPNSERLNRVPHIRGGSRRVRTHNQKVFV